MTRPPLPLPGCSSAGRWSLGGSASGTQVGRAGRWMTSPSLCLPALQWRWWVPGERLEHHQHHLLSHLLREPPQEERAAASPLCRNAHLPSGAELLLPFGVCCPSLCQLCPHACTPLTHGLLSLMLWPLQRRRQVHAGFAGDGVVQPAGGQHFGGWRALGPAGHGVVAPPAGCGHAGRRCAGVGWGGVGGRRAAAGL